MGSILVTGGAGFIGSHLVERLVEKGYNVIVVDNLLRGKIENLSNVIDGIEFVRSSITNYNRMKEIIKKSDIVFHLAAVSRVLPCIDHPELCFKCNIKGTEIIARLCSKYRKKLIFASSREVYGTAEYLPVDENHPLSPENPYGASKVCGEKIIEAYAKCYGLTYVILRIANVYGSRDFDRVIPIFIERALKKEDLIVYGGNQILDFIYIDDVTDALIKSIDLNDNNTLNIGSGTGITILNLARLICKFTNKDIQITIKSERKGEAGKFVADIKKAKEILKWSPKVSLEDGIMTMIRQIIKTPARFNAYECIRHHSKL